MVPFLINDIVTYDGKRYRLLKLVSRRLLPSLQPAPPGPVPSDSNAQAGAYVIEMEARKALPQFWPLKTLKRAKPANGEAPLNKPARGRPQQDGDPDIAVRDLRWNRIAEVIKDDRIWEKASRGPLLRRHAEAIGVAKETLLGNARLFWTGGQVKDALLGNIFNSGYVDENSAAAQVIRTKSEAGEELVFFAPPNQKARGRTRMDGVRPFAFPPKLRRVVLKIAMKHYLEDYSKSVASATIKVLARLFCERNAKNEPVRDERGRIVLKPPGQRPSKAQIRYLLKRCVAHSVAYAARHGRAQYQNDHKPRPASVRDDTVGVGDVGEIDSTIGDVVLVSRANRAKIIGKPTIYLVVDRRTRLVIGFLVTLENPSWAAAALAILSIAGDWKALCEHFKVPYDPKDWPSAGRLPTGRFAADRADMIAAASEGLTDAVGVPITNVEALMSANKAIVEICNKILQIPFRRFVPGHEPSENFRKRRGKKFHKDACLTLEEFVGRLLHAIWTHNTSPLVDYEATPEEVMSDMALTPVNLWHFHKKNSMGVGARMAPEVLRRKLLPRGIGTVKNDGLHFRHCIYYSEQIREWLVTASVAGAFEVNVSFDSNLVNNIIVYDKSDARKSFSVPLAPKCKELLNWSFLEVEQLHTRRLARRQKDIADKEAAEVTEFYAIEEVVKPALAEMREQSRGMTLGRRVSLGRVERVVEGMERREDAHDVTKPVDPYGVTRTSSEQPADATPDPEEVVPEEDALQPPDSSSRPRVVAGGAETLNRMLNGSIESV